MKGLLIKDFLYLREMKRMLAIFGAVVLSLLLAAKYSGSGEETHFFSAFSVAVTMILILNLFSSDSNAKWDLYAGSLPVDRSLSVAEKYLMTLVLTAGFSFFFGVLSCLILGSFTWDIFSNYYLDFGATLTILSVLIPLMYRFGVQKARLALLILFLLVITVSVLLEKTVQPTVTDAEMLLWLKLSPIFLLILFFGSFFVSCAIYRRKEF